MNTTKCTANQEWDLQVICSVYILITDRILTILMCMGVMQHDIILWARL